jgi:chromate reductase, NAD(P)H dehydrogenase (quinone)
MATQNRGPLTFVGIAGSLRRASYNRGLIRAAAEVAPAGIEVIAFDLSEIPLFNADVEAQGDPPAVAALKRAISDADALLIATPEYNHCVPGVLKNAIDWASRPARQAVLSGKPIGIMGASTGQGGTARAQSHLRDGLTYTNGLVLPLPEVLVGLAGQKFDDDGNLVDEQTRQDVRDLLVGLAAWTRRFQAPLEVEAAS